MGGGGRMKFKLINNNDDKIQELGDFDNSIEAMVCALRRLNYHVSIDHGGVVKEEAYYKHYMLRAECTLCGKKVYNGRFNHDEFYCKACLLKLYDGDLINKGNYYNFKRSKL